MNGVSPGRRGFISRRDRTIRTCRRKVDLEKGTFGGPKRKIRGPKEKAGHSEEPTANVLSPNGGAQVPNEGKKLLAIMGEAEVERRKSLLEARKRRSMGQ